MKKFILGFILKNKSKNNHKDEEYTSILLKNKPLGIIVAILLFLAITYAVYDFVGLGSDKESADYRDDYVIENHIEGGDE